MQLRGLNLQREMCCPHVGVKELGWSQESLPVPGMCSHHWVTPPAPALATPVGGCFAKWGAKPGGAQFVAATSVWVCFHFLAGQGQRMDPGPDSSHETEPTTQNVGPTSAWPLLLLLLHLTLCMNPIFQYMNSIFQCKNPLFWEFMNPILGYMNPPVSVRGFASTHASGISDAFALSGSSPELLPDTAVFAQQLQAALPQDTRSPLPLLLLPSQSGTL